LIDLRDDHTVHRFDREAMNTTFSVRIRHDDSGIAADAAHAGFLRLDELEDRLSRYRNGSDVDQINAMQTGQTLLITADTHGCLVAALRAGHDTGGLFDITLGVPIQHLKSGAGGPPAPPSGRLRIASDRPAVECLEAGRGIDLGGIGKGFAVGQMADVLRGWGVDSALIAGGASTLLAFGPDAWPVELRGASAGETLLLQNSTLSASGTAVQGGHVVHPDDPRRLTGLHRHVWVLGRDAASIDAFATACSLMDASQVRAFAASCAEVSGAWVEDDDGLVVGV